MSTNDGVLVRVNGVEKVFHRGSEAIRVLAGLNLEVAKGEFLALMGPSASGSSMISDTLCRTIKRSTPARAICPVNASLIVHNNP